MPNYPTAKVSLTPGQPQKIASQISGAGTIQFTIPATPGNTDRTAIFQAVGTLTSLASALQISLDGGTTFVSYIASFLAAATSLYVVSPYAPSTANGPTPITGGALFQINVTAATGPVDIWALIE